MFILQSFAMYPKIIDSILLTSSALLGLPQFMVKPRNSMKTVYKTHTFIPPIFFRPD